MTYIDWFTVAMVSAQLIVLAVTWTDWQARRQLMSVESPGLRGLPESTTRILAHRLILRLRAGTVAGLISYLAAFGLLRAIPHAFNFDDVYLLQLSWAAGFAAGTIVFATRQQLAASKSPLRYARSRALMIRDYVPPSLRVTAWLGLGCVVASVSIQDILQLTNAPFTGEEVLTVVTSTVIAAFALIGMVTFEIAGRAIVATPQPAGSTEELMWDDAIRARTLRDLATLPVAYGTLAFAFFVIRRIDWSYGVASIVVFGLSTMCLVSLVVSLLIVQTSKEHYLDRLWSNRPRSDFADRDEDAHASEADTYLATVTTDTTAPSIGGAR